MAKQKKRIQKKHRRRKKSQLPLGKKNFQIFAVGLAVIAIGFFALSQEPWNSSTSLVVAPILLVLGYCVIIPYAILYQDKTQNVGNHTSQ